MAHHPSKEPTELTRRLDVYDRAVQRAASAVRVYRSTPGHDPAAVLMHLDAALKAGFDVLEPTQETPGFSDTE